MGLVFLRVVVLLAVMLVPLGARALPGGLDSIAAARVDYDAAEGGARVMAARRLASGYHRAGRLGLAEWWLRRALRDAPDARVRAALVSEIRQVRAQNPLRVNLRFSVAPSSNINNGFDGETVLIWGLPFVLAPDARALSGLEFSGAIEVGYRVAQGAVSQTELALFAFGRNYVMSAKARQMAPDLRGSDFAFAGVSGGIVHKRRFSGLSEPTVFRLGVGQTWYGGAGYDRTLRGAVFQQIRVDRRSLISGFGSFEQRYLLQGGGRSQVYTAGVGGSRRMVNGDILDGLLVAQDVESGNVTLAHTMVRGQVVYGLAAPVWGVHLSFTAGLAQRHYPVSAYGAQGRRDLLFNSGITMKFDQVSAYGFSPLMILEYRQTFSNIPLYERRSLALRMGWQANF